MKGPVLSWWTNSGVEGSPGVPSIHPLDLTNKLHRKQPGTTTDQIVQPSVCLSFLSGSLSEFSIFSVMIFSTRDQKNEEEFGHNLPPNCLDEQLPKRPRLRFLMIHPDHLLHYSLFTINSHDLNQSSSVSVETEDEIRAGRHGEEDTRIAWRGDRDGHNQMTMVDLV
ncbi:hypothetical protein DY000_02047855 [Brassica cretica]|uniref:Uncharacterized protein n=1 Tax=Brassica cretica TaxID=69181 RepID=A0ABQ7F0H4_BRACR|nr:hypothetical protein DY000_02047855 [Brassica cretica]